MWADRWGARNKMLGAGTSESSYYTDVFGGGYYITAFVWWWVPAIAAIVFVALAPPAQSQRRSGAFLFMSRARAVASSVLQYPLPPRRLLLWWCDGVTLAEGFLVCGWIAAHCASVWSYFHYYTKNYNYLQDTVGIHFALPRWQMNLEYVALLFGWLLFWDVSVLFWPIAHNSFLHELLGLPYAGLIRYHRWVGHSAVWSLTAHGVLYYIYWIANDELSSWAEFADWGKNQSINNLAGSLAFFCSLALWLTSLDLVRRISYHVFHKMHLFGFFGFVFFGMTHYAGMWVAFVPGLVLYAADIAMRVCQSSNTTTMVSWRVLGKGKDRVAVLTIPVDKDLETASMHDYFINFPGVTRWHWHPFSSVYFNAGPGQQSTVTFCMKQKGHWTKAVIESLLKHGRVPVRVTGPMGHPTRLPYHYNHLLLIAGGVGSVPLLSLLEDLVKRKSRGGAEAQGLPLSVHMVWTARSKEEFTLVSAGVVQTATSGKKWLKVDLLYTGAAVVPLGQALKGTPAQLQPQTLKRDSLSPEDHVQPTPKLGFLEESKGSISMGTRGGCPLKFPGSSAFFWDGVRPIQPKIVSKWFYLAVALVAYLGGLLGVALSGAFNNEWDGADAPESRYWVTGLVRAIIVTVQAVGLPISLVVFPTHFFRYMCSHSAAKHKQNNKIMTLTSPRPFASLVGDQVGFEESGAFLPIKVGRLDILATLLEKSKKCGKAATVGLYCGGPDSLMNAAVLATCQANKEREGVGAYINFHRATHSL